MQLYDYLSTEGVGFDISGESKREILEQLTDVLVKKVPIKNARGIVDQLEDRERLSTTGIGFEVAVLVKLFERGMFTVHATPDGAAEEQPVCGRAVIRPT